MFGECTKHRFCFLAWRNLVLCSCSLCHKERMDGSQTLHMLFMELISSFVSFLELVLCWDDPDLLCYMCLNLQWCRRAGFYTGKLGHLFWISTSVTQYLFLFLQNIKVVTGRHTLLSADWMGGIFDLGKWRWCCYGN